VPGFLFFFFCWWYWSLNSGLVFAKQVLYNLSYSSSLIKSFLDKYQPFPGKGLFIGQGSLQKQNQQDISCRLSIIIDSALLDLTNSESEVLKNKKLYWYYTCADFPLALSSKSCNYLYSFCIVLGLQLTER
jgi:hypothetical protein